MDVVMFELGILVHPTMRIQASCEVWMMNQVFNNPAHVHQIAKKTGNGCLSFGSK